MFIIIIIIFCYENKSQTVMGMLVLLAKVKIFGKSASCLGLHDFTQISFFSRNVKIELFQNILLNEQ